MIKDLRIGNPRHLRNKNRIHRVRIILCFKMNPFLDVIYVESKLGWFALIAREEMAKGNNKRSTAAALAREEGSVLAKQHSL